MADGLLGAGLVRELAATLGVTPTKQWGQNFVHDANTVTRIVKEAGVGPHDVVLEVGPGLGSLTLALLPVVSHVVAVEIDPRLATGLPATVARLQPQHAERLSVVQADAMQVTELPVPPTALVANLPYNVAVPVVLTLLARFPSIARCLVMVQLEVAERLSARPGSKVYGTPSVKAAWYGETSLVGKVPPSVFWPVPNVDSGLVSLVRREPPVADVSREAVFACVDAAFAQRRKGLRSALAGWAGSAAEAEAVLAEAGIAPLTRGEQLSVADFCRVAAARQRRLSA